MPGVVFTERFISLGTNGLENVKRKVLIDRIYNKRLKMMEHDERESSYLRRFHGSLMSLGCFCIRSSSDTCLYPSPP